MIFETGDESASLAVGCTLSLSQRSSPTTIAQSRTRGGSNETLSTSPMLFRSTGAGAPQSPSRIGSSGATSAVIGASAGSGLDFLVNPWQPQVLPVRAYYPPLGRAPWVANLEAVRA